MNQDSRPAPRWRRVVLGLVDRTRADDWHLGLLTAAAVIGVLGALATIAFREVVTLAERALYGRSDGLVQAASHLPALERLFVPALGGICAGIVLAWARKSVSAGSSSDYMEAIALGDGQLAVRGSLLRALSSAITVSSGGAIGREGSMVQLAALVGSLFGRWRRAALPRRRLLVACGASAGVAAAYNAPIAGALFVAEIVLHSVAIESLGPLIVAAVAANLTTSQLFGYHPVYHMPMLAEPGGLATVVLALLGLIAGFGAPVYLRLLDLARHAFARWKAPLWARLGAGGLAVGAISVVEPQVWGNGYSVVNSMLQGGWLAPALLAVLVLKLLAVASTAGSGAVGGVFTPTLFVGAAVGGLFGALVRLHAPGLMPEALAIAVGMGAFLAASTHAPLMSILMIVEMTGNFGLMLPLMLSCVLAYSLSRVLQPESIYSEAAGSAAPTPATAMAVDFLRSDPAVVAEGASLDQLEQAFVHFRRPHVYVLGADGRFVGAVSIHDLAPFARQQRGRGGDWQALVRRDFPTVGDQTPVWRVLETFATHAGERLPVLDAAGKLRGYVSKSDLVLMFRERLGGAAH
ncbi:MAG: ClcB-like voltage-gated chloride channel protein [Burkholderiales bacterium]|nr:ClcB-like voltage-gated chloride channel protein [Burkholderiales bacterium]MDE2395655.1 ClcB-like voltage-gated chloride channel protein [Burkholderiales bacterium]MDE2456409.1 ClcB-like voltage-gated chloride channel protein [Burkholderiales bacterium]